MKHFLFFALLLAAELVSRVYGHNPFSNRELDREGKAKSSQSPRFSKGEEDKICL